MPHRDPTYTQLELLREMHSALLPFSRLYEELMPPGVDIWTDEGDEQIAVPARIMDLKKAHFFCRHRSVHDYLGDPDGA